MITRRAFSLIEVMVSIAILLVSLVILVNIQWMSIEMTKEARRMTTATDLARLVLDRAELSTEKEGFTDADHCEDGDFSDLGDDVADMEFGDSLEDFNYEWCVWEVDLEIGDIGGLASELGESGALPGVPEGMSAGGAAGGAAPAGFDLSALGFSPDMLTEMLSRYIRQVRVRVWWKEDNDDDTKIAHEKGQEIIITSHVINPTGAVIATQQGDPTSGQ